jgi:hypothetical protein
MAAKFVPELLQGGWSAAREDPQRPQAGIGTVRETGLAEQDGSTRQQCRARDALGRVLRQDQWRHPRISVEHGACERQPGATGSTIETKRPANRHVYSLRIRGMVIVAQRHFRRSSSPFREPRCFRPRERQPPNYAKSHAPQFGYCRLPDDGATLLPRDRRVSGAGGALGVQFRTLFLRRCPHRGGRARCLLAAGCRMGDQDLHVGNSLCARTRIRARLSTARSSAKTLAYYDHPLHGPERTGRGPAEQRVWRSGGRVYRHRRVSEQLLHHCLRLGLPDGRAPARR